MNSSDTDIPLQTPWGTMYARFSGGNVMFFNESDLKLTYNGVAYRGVIVRFDPTGEDGWFCTAVELRRFGWKPATDAAKGKARKAFEPVFREWLASSEVAHAASKEAAGIEMRRRQKMLVAYQSKLEERVAMLKDCLRRSFDGKEVDSATFTQAMSTLRAPMPHEIEEDVLNIR